MEVAEDAATLDTYAAKPDADVARDTITLKKKAHSIKVSA